MSMVFPGMDPYLENPQLWLSVHSRLVVYLADMLQVNLPSRYVTSVQERVYVEGPDRAISPEVWISQSRGPRPSGAAAMADVEEPLVVEASVAEIHESYIEILDLSSNQRVVTVMEVLSPSNKFPGRGQDPYLVKQRETLCSQAHLVEIDLLRVGPHVLAVPLSAVQARTSYDYLVCVSRAWPPRTRFELYPRRLRERLPKFGIPLADEDPDAPLDLQAVVARTYEAGTYRHRVDYSLPCKPALSAEDQAWADELIRESSGND